MGQIANRQSLVFSEPGQLWQAIPQVHAERILHKRTPIARFESQRNAGSTRTKFCGLRGRHDSQRTLVIRIAGITLASDSAITLARFRPSKVFTMHLVFTLLSTALQNPLLPLGHLGLHYSSINLSMQFHCPHD